MRRPIGIDLFAGAGGFSLGFEQAGFDVVAAVEIDPVHACVHKFNFPNCAVIPRSVSDLSGDEIRKAAKIGNRRIDVVFGGPPCQGFSLIGHRVLDDPRNSLVREFVRIVKELDARYFVFENVKGLTVGRHRKFLDEIIEAFSEIGYKVLPWRVLNASSYGVPQRRERLFLIGSKKGQRAPDYPTPTTSAAGSADRSRAFGPSCEDALGDLPNADKFDTLIANDEVVTKAWGKPSKYARKMRVMAHNDYSYLRRWNRYLLTSSLRTDHTEILRLRFAGATSGEVEPITRFFKLPRHGVAHTLRAGTDAARGAFTSPRPIHYKYPRCITVREMARLQGFPDWFRFHSTKWHGARQIGNAVAPPMAKAIADQIAEALRINPSRPVTAVDLGDPALLRMGVTEAAEHLGIDRPDGRRSARSTPNPSKVVCQRDTVNRTKRTSVETRKA